MPKVKPYIKAGFATIADYYRWLQNQEHGVNKMYENIPSWRANPMRVLEYRLRQLKIGDALYLTQEPSRDVYAWCDWRKTLYGILCVPYRDGVKYVLIRESKVQATRQNPDSTLQMLVEDNAPLYMRSDEDKELRLVLVRDGAREYMWNASNAFSVPFFKHDELPLLFNSRDTLDNTNSAVRETTPEKLAQVLVRFFGTLLNKCETEKNQEYQYT
jgi:hypothetical protein